MHNLAALLLGWALAAGIVSIPATAECPGLSSGPAPTTSATLDPAHSAVHFTLGAFLHAVHGTFAVRSGSLCWDPGSGMASGAIVISAASGTSGNSGRDKDMRNKVLLVGRYPEIVFTPGRLSGIVAPAGTSHVTVHGTLALEGLTHPLDLPLTIEVTGNAFVAQGRVEIPYVAWGLHDPSRALLRVAKSVTLDFDAAGSIAAPSAARQPAGPRSREPGPRPKRERPPPRYR